MGFYNVVKPCVVGKLHYVRPTTAPIEVDHEVAAPLVESGSLEPYRPGDLSDKTGTVLDGILSTFPEVAEVADAIGPLMVDDDESEPPATETPRPRGRRKPTEG